MATLQPKRIALFLLVIALILLSYTRDTLFIVLNAIIDHDPNNYANTPLPDFLKKMHIADIKKLKWLFAILFSALFMLITAVAVQYYFKNKQFTRLVVIIYLFLGAAAVLAEAVYYFFKLPFSYFNLVHTPINLVQSPLLLLVFFASAFIFKIEKNIRL